MNSTVPDPTLTRIERAGPAFWPVRYDRPDPRDAEAYLTWLVSASPCASTKPQPLQLPYVEDAFLIKPAGRPKRWYVVVTEPNQETKVVDDLSRERIDTYLPKRTFVRSRHRGVHTVCLPLLRGYLFAEVGASPASTVSAASPKARGVLCRENEPAPVAEEAIADLRAREAAGEFDDTSEASRRRLWAGMVKGAPVRIGNIPGVIAAVDYGREAAKVEMVFMGKTVRTWFSLAQLQLIETAYAA